MSALQNAEALLPATCEKLKTTLFEALGAASACWENPGGAGVFDSDRCKGVGDDLLDDVVILTGLGEPSLGLATSAQLIEELRARFHPAMTEEGGDALRVVEASLAGGLDYRTIYRTVEVAG